MAIPVMTLPDLSNVASRPRKESLVKDGAHE